MFGSSAYIATVGEAPPISTPSLGSGMAGRAEAAGVAVVVAATAAEAEAEAAAAAAGVDV